MAVLTTRDIFFIAAGGAVTAALVIALSVLVGLGIEAATRRIRTAWTARRDRRRALKAARRRLSTFTTINDLKD